MIMNWNDIRNFEESGIRGTVAGVSFVPGYPENLVKLKAILDGGETLPTEIKRNPNNQYDTNACEVWVGGVFIGHLPRDLAEVVAASIDHGKKLTLEVTSIGFANGDPTKPGVGFCIQEVV
jgi:hypothetical protein